jgi:hypothetical protein
LRFPCNDFFLFLPHGSQSAQNTIRAAFHILAMRLVVVCPRNQLPVRGNAHLLPKIAHEAKKVDCQIVSDQVRVGRNKLLHAH